jgi:hypothetical protein
MMLSTQRTGSPSLSYFGVNKHSFFHFFLSLDMHSSYMSFTISLLTMSKVFCTYVMVAALAGFCPVTGIGFVGAHCTYPLC